MYIIFTDWIYFCWILQPINFEPIQLIKTPLGRIEFLSRNHNFSHQNHVFKLSQTTIVKFGIKIISEKRWF